jgi:UPF0716 protein FxsA
MPFLASLLFGLGLWLFAEVFLFTLFADAIGLAGAILVTLLTSFIGAVLLRRQGHAARDALKAMIAGGASIRPAPEALQNGVSTALGAVLLILPGFLSDCVGLALIVPALRRVGRPPPAPKKPDVLDLSPQDWRRIDEADRS